MITVGIATWNEKKTIGKVLDILLDEDYGQGFEIIVVAGGNSIPVAEKYVKKNKNIILVKEIKRKGKPNALNQIFKKANGKYIILVDGDVYLKNGFSKKLINEFDDETGIVTSRPKPINSRNNIIGFWQHFLLDIAHKKRSNEKFIHAAGPLYAIKSGIIKTIRADTLADDALISRMVFDKGWKIKYASNVIVKVKYPEKIRDWIIQKRRTISGHHQINKWLGKEDWRSFSGEAKGIFSAFKYCKSIKEYLWMTKLIFFRTIVWILSYWDIITKKDFMKIWKPIESAK